MTVRPLCASETLRHVTTIIGPVAVDQRLDRAGSQCHHVAGDNAQTHERQGALAGLRTFTELACRDEKSADDDDQGDRAEQKCIHDSGSFGYRNSTEPSTPIRATGRR